MTKRKRRTFTPAYNAEVVELIHTGGKSISAVATELDLSETAVRAWVQQGTVDRVGDPAGALTTAERVELGDLRRRVKTLEMERDIRKSDGLLRQGVGRRLVLQELKTERSRRTLALPQVCWRCSACVAPGN